MDLLLLDISWMFFNIALALIPVAAGIGFIKSRNRLLSYVLALVWLVFLPNTIYLLTDVFHLVDDWNKATLPIDIFLIPFYVLIIFVGIVTFIFSLYAIENEIKKKRVGKTLRIVILCVVNILVGIGLTLGRIERINSWEVVTSVTKVSQGVFIIFSSTQLFLITAIFSLVSTTLYFSLENITILRKSYRNLQGSIYKKR